MDLGLLLLRIVVGLTLSAHGAQKLFGWFGGLGPAATGEGFAAIGFHPGRRHAVAAGAVEVAAGLLLAAGLATPLAAAMVVSVMVVAAMAVHVPNGFFITESGFEYNLVFGTAALVLAFTGPGTWSLDALFGWRVAGDGWGLAAAAFGAVGAAVQLAQRRAPAARR